MGFNGATSNRTWKRVQHLHPRRGTHWLQWGHVQSDVETRILAAVHGTVVLLQWGHVQSDVETIRQLLWSDLEQQSFNGATSNRTWKLPVPSAGVRGASRFNGATSNRTWKHFTCRYKPACQRCFNGATSNRTWKPGRPRYSGTPRNGFNGATSNRTWKQRISYTL